MSDRDRNTGCAMDTLISKRLALSQGFLWYQAEQGMRDSRPVFLNKNALKDVLTLALSSHCSSKTSNTWPVEQIEHLSAVSNCRFCKN